MRSVESNESTANANIFSFPMLTQAERVAEKLQIEIQYSVQPDIQPSLSSPAH